uniref:Uncharacterized protein n=1 Tax=Euplotes crassus TaxID=5936 RepID=A0A7S3KSM8_EUPCR|mmetsp:Transcript_4185/g.3928  ORF Transcript_4185/g.3928 Transcript_4185/m.3928 type:complete len:224 (+) Transcript_4185:267-938(+)
MKRDPNRPLRVKNNIDLSIFDKPRVQLSKSLRGSEVIRDSVKEDDFLPLNFTKPAKKEIILTDNPDFTVDKQYYQEEFQKPPEEDEDLLQMSMKSGHPQLDDDPIFNTKQPSDIYTKDQILDETHRQSQLLGQMDQPETIVEETNSRPQSTNRQGDEESKYNDDQERTPSAGGLDNSQAGEHNIADSTQDQEELIGENKDHSEEGDKSEEGNPPKTPSSSHKK